MHYAEIRLTRMVTCNFNEPNLIPLMKINESIYIYIQLML